MRTIFRTRNVVFLLALPILLVATNLAEFAWRTNSCAPGDHVIESEANAIAVAKQKMVKYPKFSSDEFGSAPDFVDSLSGVEDCCFATRYRNSSFVVVWEVTLSNKANVRNHRAATLHLSNCGSTVFTGESYIDYGN